MISLYTSIELYNFIHYKLAWIIVAAVVGTILYYTITLLYKDVKEFSTFLLWFIISFLNILLALTQYFWISGNIKAWVIYFVFTGLSVFLSHLLYRKGIERIAKAVVLVMTLLIIFACCLTANISLFIPIAMGILQGGSSYFCYASFKEYLRVKQNPPPPPSNSSPEELSNVREVKKKP